MFRLSVVLVFVGLQLACGSTPPDEPKTPWDSEKCAPGSMQGCQCGTDEGLQQCDHNGLWGACACSGDVSVETDVAIPGDATSVTPSQANQPSAVTPVSGVGRLISENYELQIVIGPTSPVASASSESYSVHLGPVGRRSAE